MGIVILLSTPDYFDFSSYHSWFHLSKVETGHTS